MNDETDLERLQEIMDELPDQGDFNPERRKYSLTKADVLMIYKIARIALPEHICPFKDGEAKTLKGMAGSVSRTQKLASVLVATAIIGAIISGIGAGLMHLVRDFIQNGGQLK